MKILILDDMELRHNAFANFFRGHDVTHAFTFSEFVDFLNESSPFDLICLDHDLGDFIKNPDFWLDSQGRKREFNGQHAAVKVTELPDDMLPRQVLIHSINPVGAQAMLKIIRNKGLNVIVKPFKETDYI